MGRFQMIVFQFLFLCFCLFVPVLQTAHADLNHQVLPGESLASIAKKYNLSVDQLRETNGLSGNLIRAGDTLVIPQGPATNERKTTGQKVQTRGSENSEIPETYTVKKGDTLGQIAKRYHLSVQDLQEINHLQGKKLQIGQVINLIPEETEETLEETGEGPGGENGKTQEEDPRILINGNGFLVEDKDRELLARVAKSFVGAKYRRGGTSINGMDCSAFVQKIFHIFGIDLPRTVREQYQVGYPVPKENFQVGDLLFFKRNQKSRQPSHVGIYLGDEQFIHTSLSKRQVEMDTTQSRYFLTRFIGARRIEETKAESNSE
jgi:peptidoglycan DL-endopeptidase LytE